MQLKMISSAWGLEFFVPAEGIVSLFLTQGVAPLLLPPLLPQFPTGSLLNSTPSHLARVAAISRR